MLSKQKIDRLLAQTYGTAVRAEEKDGVLTLTGSLSRWQDVVAAGQLCADKKSRRMLVNDIQCTGEEKPPMRLPALQDEALSGTGWDVVIIGAGVVGAAAARELSRYRLRVLLLEKEHDVGLGASCRNDGMVHPGVDLHPWQKKQKYDLRGNAMYEEFCRQLQVPFARTGQVIGVTEPWMRLVLPVAPLYWRRMGVPCHWLSRKKLLAAEPGLSPETVGGLSFPTAGIVCPYGLTIACAENAVQNGVTLSLDTAVTGIQVEAGVIRSLTTNRGTLTARVVVNAAGVFCDEVAQLAGDRFYSIHPRRGTNSILDKKAAFRVNTIASFAGTAAVKTSHSKGGGLVRTADGNLLVGPDAVETPRREDYATTAQSVRQTFEKQKVALPALSQRDIITYFTGVRAATYEEDFVICRGRKTKNLIHAAGIQSPGLTAAPAIAQDVAKLALGALGGESAVEKNPGFDPVRPAIRRTADLPDDQRDALIRANPDYGVIVCRCEEVSRGEIIEALHRPVPCDTVDGVKRRVRPGMGRCQGGFCGPQVVQIIAQELGLSPDQVKKSGDGSELLAQPTKGEVPDGSAAV